MLIFCICQDSIHVPEHGSNPGPHRAWICRESIHVPEHGSNPGPHRAWICRESIHVPEHGSIPGPPNTGQVTWILAFNTGHVTWILAFNTGHVTWKMALDWLSLIRWLASEHLAPKFWTTNSTCYNSSVVRVLTLLQRTTKTTLSAQGTWIESPDLSALHLPGFDPCPVELAQIVNKERRRPLQCSLYCVQCTGTVPCAAAVCLLYCTALHCTGRPAGASSQSGSGSHLEDIHPTKRKVTSNTPQTFDFGSICTWNILF